MPLNISTDAVTEKNKLASSSPWIILLEIAYPDEAPVRVCYNTENVTWDGFTWYAVPFELGDLDHSKEESTPSVSLNIVDIERRIIPTIDQYNGGVGATVYIRVVHADHLDNADAEIEEVTYIKDVVVDHASRVKFTLGAENLTNLRNPPDRFLKGHCRYKEFKGSLCGYSGTETECNRTFERCRELGNQKRFGGFPGVGRQGYFE